MDGCGRSCQVSSRSTCATSKRLMDLLPANDLIITAGGEFYDIILQRCEQMLCFVKTQEGTGFQMGQDCTASSPLAAPTGCLRTPPLPLSRTCILRHSLTWWRIRFEQALRDASNSRTGTTGRTRRKRALKHGRRQPWAVGTGAHPVSEH